MHTFFNLKIKETNDKMRDELSRVVLPYLKEQGWIGTKSRFRRICNGNFQTLDVQFNKWGGSFAINLSLVEAKDNFIEVNFENIKTVRSQRLGTRKKRIAKKFNMDHWFRFMKGIILYYPSYKAAADSVVKIYENEAEQIFNDMLESSKNGVLCIHLEKV